MCGKFASVTSSELVYFYSLYFDIETFTRGGDSGLVEQYNIFSSDIGKLQLLCFSPVFFENKSGDNCGTYSFYLKNKFYAFSFPKEELSRYFEERELTARINFLYLNYCYLENIGS